MNKDTNAKMLDKDVEFYHIFGGKAWSPNRSFYIAPGKLVVLTEPRHTAPKYTLRLERMAQNAQYFSAEEAKDELEKLGKGREPGHNGWLNHEFEILGALRFEKLQTSAQFVISDLTGIEPDASLVIQGNMKNTNQVQYHRIEELTRERERDSDVVLWGQILLLINASNQELSWQSLPFPQHDKKPEGAEDLTAEQAIEALYHIGQDFDPAAGKLLGAVILRGGGLEVIVRDKNSSYGLGIDVYCANG